VTRRQCIGNPAFLPLISLLIRQDFSRDGITNFHNQHLWEDKKQEWILHSIHQEQFSLNAGDSLLQPYFIPEQMTGSFIIFPTEHPSRATASMWKLQTRISLQFMCKGAQFHFLLAVCTFLNVFPQWQKGWGRTIAMSAHSPGLKPLRLLFLWKSNNNHCCYRHQVSRTCNNV
jgi:hypothetical protein